MKIQNPATETTITEVEADTLATVAAKVAAARAAQPGWAAVPLAERVAVIRRFRDAVASRARRARRHAHG